MAQPAIVLGKQVCYVPVVTLLLAVLVAPFVILTTCFAVEVLAGLRPLRSVDQIATPVSAAVVVPAHNEAAILRDRLDALKAAVGTGARLILVADNCDDSTAQIGRELGAEVIERFDAAHRGKGFALGFARDYLAADPPDVVVIVDADCSTDPQSIANLINHCAVTNRPCQSVYLQSPAEHGPTVQLSTFAFFLKNLIRQRGLQRLSGRVLLVGSGMSFPWEIFSKAALATDNIVEDLKLGLELAQAGHPPLLVEGSTVWGGSETVESTLSQRRRWEGGFLAIALRTAPSALARAVARIDRREMWSALSLMIPPFTLLFAVDVALLGTAAGATWLSGAQTWPLLVLFTAVLLAGSAIVMAWRSGGRRFVPFPGLIGAPLYVVWKIPLYLGLAKRGAPKEWLRTQRKEQ